MITTVEIINMQKVCEKKNKLESKISILLYL